MTKLSEVNRAHVRKYLTAEGLTFDPLLEEMLDHISSDIEERMAQGLSFEQAWQEVQNSIPENHFINIQSETMETINKRFSLSRILSITALALIFGGVIFKILHLAGADQLLILSFSAMAGSFLAGTVSGVYFNREKKGALRIFSILSGTLLLMAGFTFKLMHWPGGNGIVAVGIGVSLLSFLINTVYVYRNRSPHVNLLSHLHEKHTPGIERFFLILLIPIAILKMLTLSEPRNLFLGNIILVTIIYGGGVQFFVLLWRLLEKESTERNKTTFFFLVLSIICFTLVFLGELLTVQIRLVLISLFTIATAWIVFKLDPPKNYFVAIVLGLVTFVFTANTLMRLNLIPLGYPLIFNMVILLILAAGIFVSKKHEPTRAFMILSMAGYLVEYQ